MLPQNVLSTTTISAAFRYPRNIPRTDIVDYELGGIDFNNPSQGLEVRTWRGSLNVTNGQISLETIGVPLTLWYTAPGATRFSFTFDSNMNPLIAWDTEATSQFYWFDTAVGGYVVTILPSGSKYVTVGLDDHRALESTSRDIILAYLRDGSLYFRAQRDRYLVEYTLGTGYQDYKLNQTGLNEKLRFQFQLVPI